MKKTLLLTLALMPSLLLHSQEASEDNYLELSLIPRLETTINSIPNEKFNLGNSSLYALFEGQYNNLSWTISTHFINAGGDYAWPYTSLGYSYTTNFLDMLLLNYSFDNWTFSIGKDILKTGGNEYEHWDWESHSLFYSNLNNYLSAYQWGLSATYSFSENNSISLQATTSPFGYRPFSSKLFAYSLQWRGEYDWATFLWSISALEWQKGQFNHLYALGQSFNITDELNLTIDWNNLYDIDESLDEDFFFMNLVKGSSIKATLGYELSDKFDITAKIVNTSAKNLPNFLKTGLTLQYYPLEDLRLHTSCAYHKSPDNNGFYFNIGALYYIRIIK